MRCACLMGGVCGAGVIRCTRGSMPVMARFVSQVTPMAGPMKST